MDDFLNLLQEIRQVEGKRMPNMAIIGLPNVLSDATKKRMLESKVEIIKLAEALVKAIDEINEGSVERVDVLVNRCLDELNTFAK